MVERGSIVFDLFGNVFICNCALFFIFPTDEWEAGYREKEKRRIKAKFGDNLALRDFVKDVKLVMMKKKSPKKNSAKYDKVSNGEGALMRSSSDISEEELDIDWRQGWSRIEQYINIVESGEVESGEVESEEDESAHDANIVDDNDLKLEVEMTENNSDSGHMMV